MQGKPDLVHPFPDRREYAISFAFAVAVDHDIVDVAFEPGGGELPGHPRIERGRKCAYPLPSAPEALDRELGRLLRGLEATRPDLVAIVRAHQSWSPGHGWLAELARWSNEHKHVHLVTHVREETRWLTVDVPGGRLVMRPLDDGQGGLVFNEDVMLNGVISDVTVRPTGLTEDCFKELVYVDWIFAGTETSVFDTLQDIQVGVAGIVQEFRAALGGSLI